MLTLLNRLLRRLFPRPVDPNEAVFVSAAGLWVPRSLADWFIHYEPTSSGACLDKLEPGMTVVDVGAHIGYYTVQAAKRVGPTGKVYAVEPSPTSRALLQRNVVGFPQVIILPFAAGARNQLRRLRIAASEDMNGFYGHPLCPTVDTIEVQQVRLDDLIAWPVDAVKMDVEGAEMEALDGMIQLFQTHPHLSIEWNPKCLRHAGGDPERVWQRLEAWGYTALECIEDETCMRWPLPELLKTAYLKDHPYAYFNLIG